MIIIHFTMITRQEPFSKLAHPFKRLKRNVGKKRSDIIRKYEIDLICLLSECCYNILNGNVPLTLAQKTKLHRHKQPQENFQEDVFKHRRKILQRGSFLGALTTHILSVCEYSL